MIACQRTRGWVLPHSSNGQRRRTGWMSCGIFFCVSTLIYCQCDWYCFLQVNTIVWVWLPWWQNVIQETPTVGGTSQTWLCVSGDNVRFIFHYVTDDGRCRRKEIRIKAHCRLLGVPGWAPRMLIASCFAIIYTLVTSHECLWKKFPKTYISTYVLLP